MAGGNIRDIKIRIVSVKKTQKITSALKMVAAAKFKKNQSLIYQLRKYSDSISNLMANLVSRTLEIDNELFKEKKGNTLYVIVSSDRGLCGGFNQNIFRKFLKDVPAPVDVLPVGNKALAFLKNSDYNIVDSFTGISESMTTEEIQQIVDKILELYSLDKYTKVIVSYNEFKSAIAQNIVSEELLPIDINDFNEIEVTDKTEYSFEPSESEVVDTLAQKYIFSKVQRTLLESATAEQGSRMTAMESATDNADDLINNLTLVYNRARQSAITTELTEIVAGAEGIK